MFFTIAVITSLAQHQRNEALAHGQVPLRTRSEVAKQYPYPFEGGIRAPKGEPSPLPLTSLHHLILVGCDEPGQTAGQQHANQLGECNPKSHSSDDSHVGLHETGHQIITTLKTETQSQRHVLSRPNGPGLSYHTHTYTPIFISQIQ